MKLNKLPQSQQSLAPCIPRHSTASILRQSILLAIPVMFSLPAMAADSVTPTPPVSAPVSTQTAPQSVIIRETKNSESERRHDTNARVVIDHAELTRYGDQALTDALKRIPGITITTAPGKPPEIRLRGLGNGYTQILLNGEPAPAGFSFDSLSPELIERIEVLRAASAEFGAQAISGTVNIILKKTASKAEREFKLGLTRNGSELAPNASVQVSDQAGRLAYSVTATLNRTQSRTHNDYDYQERASSAQSSKLLLQRWQQEDYLMRNDTASLASRLTWNLTPDEQVVWQSYLSNSRVGYFRDATEVTSVGAWSDYPNNRVAWESHNSVVRSDLNWINKFANGAKLDVKVGISQMIRHTDFDFFGSDQANKPTGIHNVVSGYVVNGIEASGKYFIPYIDDHAFVFGWSGGSTRRTEHRNELDTDQNGAFEARSDDQYSAVIKRLALFAQDEWDISSTWSANLGLRWEGMETTAGGDHSATMTNRTSVFSPLAQMVWKLPQKQQLRLALARTYKAPSLFELVPRLFRVDNANNPFNPDTKGNPALRPELAWSLDGAYERYFEGGGMWSAGVFLRKIDNVIHRQLSVNNDIWTSVYINDGRATTYGFELEAKLPLNKLVENAPDIELHGNLVRSYSRIANLPGPDNRLDAQVPLSANLGLDYRVNPQFTLGGNFAFESNGPVQMTTYSRSVSKAKRDLDVYGLWKYDGNTQLRLSIANLLAQDEVEQETYNDGKGMRSLSTRTPSHRVMRVVLERKF